MFMPDFTSGVTLGYCMAAAGSACAIIAFIKLRRQKAQRVRDMRERNKQRVSLEGSFDAFITPGGFRPSSRKMTSLEQDRREAGRMAPTDQSSAITSPLAAIIDTPIRTASDEERSKPIGSDYDSGPTYSSSYSSDSSSSSDSGGGGGGGD